jgi:hypothetical protein
MAHAPEKTLSILVRAENGIWQTSVGGFGDKTPPMKDEQILAWAKKVRVPSCCMLSIAWEPAAAAARQRCQWCGASQHLLPAALHMLLLLLLLALQ